MLVKTGTAISQCHLGKHRWMPSCLPCTAMQLLVYITKKKFVHFAFTLVTDWLGGSLDSIQIGTGKNCRKIERGKRHAAN